MENVKNRADVRPIANVKEYQKLGNILRFFFQKIFSKNLVAVHKTKEFINQLTRVGVRPLTFITII